MSLTGFVLFREKYYPPSLQPRIEAGTANIRNYRDSVHKQLVIRWYEALKGGPLTRPQLGDKLGCTSPNATLVKMRRLGYVKEAGTCRHHITNNPTKLWEWSGPSEGELYGITRLSG